VVDDHGGVERLLEEHTEGRRRCQRGTRVLFM
jgi:hypothetical protein